MTADADQSLAQLREAAAECRDLIREAHAATKDLRSATREAERVVPMMTTRMMREQVQEAVKKGLEDYAQSINDAVESATAAAQRRFDRLSDILLGKGTDFDIEEGVLSGKVRAGTALKPENRKDAVMGFIRDRVEGDV